MVKWIPYSKFKNMSKSAQIKQVRSYNKFKSSSINRNAVSASKSLKGKIWIDGEPYTREEAKNHPYYRKARFEADNRF